MKLKNWLPGLIRLQISFALSLAALLLISCASQFAKNNSPKYCRIVERLPSMGTMFEYQVIANCSSVHMKDSHESELYHVKKNIVSILDKIENELSLYQSHSPITKLNRGIMIQNISDDFIFLVNKSKQIENATDGAFNIAILPVLNSVKDSFKKNRMPPNNLNSLRPLIDTKQISVNSPARQIKLQTKGMAITLDGIAKGYAVDKVAEILNTTGFNRFLINFSGNMRWAGTREDGQYWKINIWNAVTESTVQISTLILGAISTSGIEHNYYDTDKKWHHLISPKTLMPASDYNSVTVIANNATDADALSTAAFMMSKNEIKKLIANKSFNNLQIYMIDNHGRLTTLP